MPIDFSIQTPERMRCRQLIDALRGDMSGWTWDFAHVMSYDGTAGCAIGLTMKMWPELRVSGRVALGKFFGLTPEQVRSCFFPSGYGGTIDVTPAMVATALENTLISMENYNV